MFDHGIRKTLRFRPLLSETKPGLSRRTRYIRCTKHSTYSQVTVYIRCRPVAKCFRCSRHITARDTSQAEMYQMTLTWNLRPRPRGAAPRYLCVSTPANAWSVENAASRFAFCVLDASCRWMPRETWAASQVEVHNQGLNLA